MSRLLIVAQKTAGIGKTMIVRGLAKAKWNAPTLAIRSNKRFFKSASEPAKGGLAVTRYPTRAERTDVERSGSQAARVIDGTAVKFALPPCVGHTGWLDRVSHIAISANFPPAGKPGFAPGHFNSSHR